MEITSLSACLVHMIWRASIFELCAGTFLHSDIQAVMSLQLCDFDGFSAGSCPYGWVDSLSSHPFLTDYVQPSLWHRGVWNFISLRPCSSWDATPPPRLGSLFYLLHFTVYLIIFLLGLCSRAAEPFELANGGFAAQVHLTFHTSFVLSPAFSRALCVQHGPASSPLGFQWLFDDGSYFDTSQAL